MWNSNVNGWSLNFMSRVKMPSVKNFQLVEERGLGDEGGAGLVM